MTQISGSSAMQGKSQTTSPLPDTFSTIQVIFGMEEGQEIPTTMFPSPASPSVMLFSAQGFFTPNPIIFILLKKSMLLNSSQAGFLSFLTCEEGKTIPRDLNQEANRSSEDFLGIRSLKRSGQK